MTINENKKLSKNTKRKTARRLKINDESKSILNKIKSEKKKKNKTFDKFKKIEIDLVKIKYVNNPNQLQTELENGTRRAQIPRKLLIFPTPNKQTNKQTNKKFCPHRGSNSWPSRF